MGLFKKIGKGIKKAAKKIGKFALKAAPGVSKVLGKISTVARAIEPFAAAFGPEGVAFAEGIADASGVLSKAIDIGLKAGGASSSAKDTSGAASGGDKPGALPNVEPIGLEDGGKF